MTLKSFEDTYGAFYKTLRTSRGLTYRFLYVPPAAAHGTTLLWLHGFPSSTFEWHHQFDFFRAKGYGLLAPDMLGYGGTDKPADAAQYARSAMAADMLDIIKSLNLTAKPVAISHDWGSQLLARIADLYADEFAAFAFFTVSYMPPSPVPHVLENMLSYYEKLTGKPIIAYWEYFTKDGADKVMEKNFDSFLDLLHPVDTTEVWGNVFCARGETEAFLTQNKRVPRATYISDEEYAAQREHLLGPGRGLLGPLNWYTAMAHGANDADDIPLSKKGQTKLAQPVFFAACYGDPVCHPERQIPLMQALAADLTVAEFPGGHWPYLEFPDKLNADLDKWLEEKVVKA